MKNYFFGFVIAFSCIIAGENAFCQGFLKVEGKQIVNGTGNPFLLRGIGLGGWMLQ
jgi:hypothetical protein